MVRSALSIECFAYPPPRFSRGGGAWDILLGLAVDGCLPHGGTGVVVDAGKDGVDLIKEFIVALAQTHAGALGRQREAAALIEGDQVEVRVGSEVALRVLNVDDDGVAGALLRLLVLGWKQAVGA